MTEQINNITDLSLDSSKYQILITNIFWNTKSKSQYNSKVSKISDLPSQFVLDLPDNILSQANKKTNVFEDIIETFCYNFLTRKFGYEVNHCQIFLPLDK